MERFNRNRWLQAFVFGVCLIIAYKLISDIGLLGGALSRLLGVLRPLFIGLVMAYLLNIPMSSLENLLGRIKGWEGKKRCRALAVTATYLLLVLVIIVLVQIILPAVSHGITTFVSNLPVYYDNAAKLLDGFKQDGYLPQDISLDTLFSFSSLQNLISQIQLTDVWNYVERVLGVSSMVLNVFLGVALSVFLLLEKEISLAAIRRLLAALLPERILTPFMRYVRLVNESFYSFIYVELITMVIVGIVAYLVLTLLGTTYASVLGPFIGICNAVPFVGAIFAVAVAVLLILFTDGFTKALIALLLLLVIQQLEGNVLKPRLLGVSLQISPVLIIVAITVGGAYFGALGMIIAVPVATVLKKVIVELLDYFEGRKKKPPEAGG